MNKKQFYAIESIDDDIREAMLEVYGCPPDDFIDGSQGGGIDSEALFREDPAANQALTDALDKELGYLGAAMLADNFKRH
jgi:hypothetical protein